MLCCSKFKTSGLFWLWVAPLVFVLDRFSKYWALNNLTPGEPLELLPFFNLMLAYNKGAAFSFLHSASGWQNILLGSIAALVSFFILIWLAKLPRTARWMSIALTFILGGALSNACDRVLYGYVIDYFDFHLQTWHFAIFNVADSAICIGAFMLVIGWLFSFEGA
jgi:signal peptidase II